jgi:hypothetical protein
MKVKKNKLEKIYYFIFESSQAVEHDYLVLTMDKQNNPDSVFVQDIVKKFDILKSEPYDRYSLCCILSDENFVYLILYTTVEFETPSLYESD